MTTNRRPRVQLDVPKIAHFVRVSDSFLRTIDEWRRGQTDLPSRAEAIRRMVELASKIKKKKTLIAKRMTTAHVDGFEIAPVIDAWVAVERISRRVPAPIALATTQVRQACISN